MSYVDCKNGDHNLIPIHKGGESYEQHVVRWCKTCGAVVVDCDYDGRTAAGYYMKMKVPAIFEKIKN